MEMLGEGLAEGLAAGIDAIEASSRPAAELNAAEKEAGAVEAVD